MAVVGLTQLWSSGRIETMAKSLPLPGLPNMKFIVQPAGAIIHDPGRMPIEPGSGASFGAATGAPLAASTRAASAFVNHAGPAAFSGIAWPCPYGIAPSTLLASTLSTEAPSGGAAAEALAEDPASTTAAATSVAVIQRFIAAPCLTS